MKAAPRNRRRHGRQPDLRKVVHALFRRIRSPARVIELYYWSLESRLCDVMRAIVAMPPETRQSLEAFLAIASKADAIHASLDSSGRLTLSSQEVVDALDRLSDIEAIQVDSHRLH